MIVFSIVTFQPNPVVNTAVKKHFPQDSLKVSDTCWLVAGTGTAQEVSTRLGITAGGMGSTLVLSIAGYYGRAPSNIWEWIKAKLEAPVVG